MKSRMAAEDVLTLAEFAKCGNYDVRSIQTYYDVFCGRAAPDTATRYQWDDVYTQAQMLSLYARQNRCSQSEQDVAIRASFLALAVLDVAEKRVRRIKRPTETLARYIGKLRTLRRRSGPEYCGPNLDKLREAFPAYAYMTWLPSVQTQAPQDYDAVFKDDFVACLTELSGNRPYLETWLKWCQHRPTIDTELRIAVAMQRMEKPKPGRRPRANCSEIVTRLASDFLWLTGSRSGFPDFFRSAVSLSRGSISGDDILRSHASEIDHFFLRSLLP